MKRLVLLAQPVRALSDIQSWSEAQWGAQRADRYVDGLLSVVDTIAVGPLATARRLAGSRGWARFFVRYRQHYIYWTENDAEVRIVAILQTAMRQETQLAGLGWKLQ